MSRLLLVSFLSLAACSSSSPTPVFERKAAEIEAKAASSCTLEDWSGCFDACNAGDGHACLVFGGVMKKQQNLGVAYKAFHAGCEAGNGCACSALGWACTDAQGTPVDHTLALIAFTRGCAASCENGCLGLAYSYANGFGVEESASKAVELYARACELSSARGCGALGIALIIGYGVAPDRSRGVELLKKACADDDEIACTQLKNLPKTPVDESNKKSISSQQL